MELRLSLDAKISVMRKSDVVVGSERSIGPKRADGALLPAQHRSIFLADGIHVERTSRKIAVDALGPDSVLNEIDGACLCEAKTVRAVSSPKIDMSVSGSVSTVSTRNAVVSPVAAAPSLFFQVPPPACPCLTGDARP
jgi:hypothetical protein